MTLDQLSGGRFLLGLGVSGPQVVEGWHGVPFGKPLARTREYVEIVRAVWRREKPVEFTGEYYQIPYRGADATGLGKPLKSILHGRADIPIYLAAIGPRNVALAAEIADGWLPIFFSPERDVRVPRVAREGFRAAAGGKSLATFDIAPTVAVVSGDDVAACRAAREAAARALRRRHGRARQELLQRAGRAATATRATPGASRTSTSGGRKDEAAAAVPDALVDEVALCGPRERIRERLAAWKALGVHDADLRVREAGRRCASWPSWCYRRGPMAGSAARDRAARGSSSAARRVRRRSPSPAGQGGPRDGAALARE